MPTYKNITPAKTTGRFSKFDDKMYTKAKWKKLAKLSKQLQPLCYVCTKNGVTTIGDVSDHHLPVRLWPTKAYDMSNLKTMCHSHHNQKSAIERNIFNRAQWMQVFADHELFSDND